MSESAPPAKRKRRNLGGLTLHDIAKMAGVSAITASRAINTPDMVSEGVREKIRVAIAETGYVPNILAGGLASQNSRLVSVVVPTIVGPVFQETVQSLIAALGVAGYQVMLGQSGYENSSEDALLEAIIGRRPAGIVLTGIMHSPQSRQRLGSIGVPIVETWDLCDTPLDFLVGFSHEKIGAAVAAYLGQARRSRIATIHGDDERSMRRAQAFSDAAVAAGLVAPGVQQVPSVTVKPPGTIGKGRQGLAELLQQHPDVDAIFCSSDQIALGVMTEAAVRGISVPEQLSVIGFGDLDFARDLEPALTTVRIDGTRIGQEAARFIVDALRGEPLPERICDVGFSIIERRSVAMAS